MSEKKFTMNCRSCKHETAVGFDIPIRCQVCVSYKRRYGVNLRWEPKEILLSGACDICPAKDTPYHDHPCTVCLNADVGKLMDTMKLLKKELAPGDCDNCEHKTIPGYRTPCIECLNKKNREGPVHISPWRSSHFRFDKCPECEYFGGGYTGHNRCSVCGETKDGQPSGFEGRSK